MVDRFSAALLLGCRQNEVAPVARRDSVLGVECAG